jgi:hypothetical protein
MTTGRPRPNRNPPPNLLAAADNRRPIAASAKRRHCAKTSPGAKPSSAHAQLHHRLRPGAPRRKATIKLANNAVARSAGLEALATIK